MDKRITPKMTALTQAFEESDFPSSFETSEELEQLLNLWEDLSLEEYRIWAEMDSAKWEDYYSKDEKWEDKYPTWELKEENRDSEPQPPYGNGWIESDMDFSFLHDYMMEGIDWG